MTRLSAGQFGLAYLAVLTVLLVLDGMWLGVVAKGLYQREMGSLLADSVRIGPAVLFYALYPAALVYLTLFTEPRSWTEAALRGAVLGVAAYGAYNLTNLAILRDWPIRISAVDWVWGTFLGSVSATAGYAATWGRA